MIRGLFTATTGLVAAQQRTDIIADNIANVDTPGFKKSVGTLRTFDQVLGDRVEGQALPGAEAAESSPIGGLAHGVVLDQVVTVHSPGARVETGNPTDLALEGPGYFQVSTPAGVRYTRKGDFQVDALGKLVTNEGYAVLGTRGEIEGLTANNFAVLPDGRIQVSGQTIDKMALVDIPPAALLRQGNGLYSAQGQPLPAMDSQVRQGYREQSNVDLAEEMTNLINVQRSYQANQRMIQTLDSTLDKAVNEIARI